MQLIVENMNYQSFEIIKTILHILINWSVYNFWPEIYFIMKYRRYTSYTIIMMSNILVLSEFRLFLQKMAKKEYSFFYWKSRMFHTGICTGQSSKSLKKVGLIFRADVKHWRQIKNIMFMFIWRQWRKIVDESNIQSKFLLLQRNLQKESSIYSS